MYLQYRLMKTLQDERLRAAARDHLAAEARRARTAGRDHAAATRAEATAGGAATMPRKQGAIIGLGIPLGAILLFPQGIIPAVLKLAHARGRIWFLPLYLPKPLQWPACFVMIILGVAVYCYVLWTMRQLKKSSRELHAGKGGGRSPKSALTRIGTGQNLGPTCLLIPARRVTRRTILAAPCRPSRRPPAATNSGPSVRSPIAKSIALAVRGASGMVTTLPSLRVITRVRWPRVDLGRSCYLLVRTVAWSQTRPAMTVDVVRTPLTCAVPRRRRNAGGPGDPVGMGRHCASGLVQACCDRASASRALRNRRSGPVPARAAASS
jgi:hypothetical protein